VTEAAAFAAEIKPVHQCAGHQAVADLGAIRPARVPNQRDAAENEHHEHHAHGQEGQRLDIGQTVTGADETGAPQQHEQHRRGRDRHSAQAHEGLGMGAGAGFTGELAGGDGLTF
jgi:hypothetical protein